MKNQCTLCKDNIEGPGHNADPLADGICCDRCNMDVVLKRISVLFRYKCTACDLPFNTDDAKEDLECPGCHSQTILDLQGGNE